MFTTTKHETFMKKVTKLVNKERVVELLDEREITNKLMVNADNSSDWVIYFKFDRLRPGDSIFHTITPNTKVEELWWLS